MKSPLDPLETGRLRLDDLTGPARRIVRVAVVDSGVHPGHPHVGEADTGVSFDAAGAAGTHRAGNADE